MLSKFVSQLNGPVIFEILAEELEIKLLQFRNNGQFLVWCLRSILTKLIFEYRSNILIWRVNQTWENVFSISSYGLPPQTWQFSKTVDQPGKNVGSITESTLPQDVLLVVLLNLELGSNPVNLVLIGTQRSPSNVDSVCQVGSRVTRIEINFA